MKRKLYRSRKDKMVSGLIGGIAEYIDVDATIIRLLWVLVVIFSGIFPGVIVYIIGVLIVPVNPVIDVEHTTQATEPTQNTQTGAETTQKPPQA